MESAWIVLRQTAVMAILMAVGYLLFRFKKISVEGSKSMASLLFWVAIPSVILNSFCIPRTAEKDQILCQSTILAIVALGLAMIVSWLVYRKKPIDEFGSAFSNAGFIGIPLVQAAYGQEMVFGIVALIALLNILQCTWGILVMTHKRESVAPAALLKNPIIWASVLGVILYLSGAGAYLPDVVTSAVGFSAGMNTPIAMMVLGVYLAQTNLRSMVTDPGLYGLSLLRIVVIPTLTLAVFLLLPFDTTLRMAVFVAAAAPVGANVAIYAQLHGLDYQYACKTVTLTTLLSVILLPLMVALAGWVM